MQDPGNIYQDHPRLVPLARVPSAGANDTPTYQTEGNAVARCFPEMGSDSGYRPPACPSPGQAQPAGTPALDKFRAFLDTDTEALALVCDGGEIGSPALDKFRALLDTDNEALALIGGGGEVGSSDRSRGDGSMGDGRGVGSGDVGGDGSDSGGGGGDGGVGGGRSKHACTAGPPPGLPEWHGSSADSLDDEGVDLMRI